MAWLWCPGRQRRLTSEVRSLGYPRRVGSYPATGFMSASSSGWCRVLKYGTISLMVGCLSYCWIHTGAKDLDSHGAFGDPLPLLPQELREEFAQGFQIFVRKWSYREGLGPFANAASCATCHSEPVPGGSGTSMRSFVPVLAGANGQPDGFLSRFRVSVDDQL